jgi:hypothetical protein
MLHRQLIKANMAMELETAPQGPERFKIPA